MPPYINSMKHKIPVCLDLDQAFNIFYDLPSCLYYTNSRKGIYMKIEHIAVNVNNLEKAKEFFVDYFGVEVNDLYHNSKTGLKTYFLSFESGARLELMHYPEFDTLSNNHPNTLGYIHIAISVGSKESVDELTDRLLKDGYVVLSGPRTTGDGYYESCVEGIEGIKIEITI